MTGVQTCALPILISGLRSIRTTAELHPGAQIKATLICPNAERRQLLKRYRANIMTMTKAEELAIVAAGAVPNDAGHALVGDVELVVPLRDLLDVAGELEKLARERAKLEAERARPDRAQRFSPGRMSLSARAAARIRQAVRPLPASG